MTKHYHFIGVGGIGMGGLALLLHGQGHRISGSDIKESAMTATLREKGAAITIGHDPKNIQAPDFVIYSSAIGERNPEYSSAKDRGIPILKRAELLASLMKEKIGITVAGAHGKTTTTSMTSGLLLKANLKPTIAVGGIVNTLATNAQLGDGKYFVAEVDESDGSFLYFAPTYSIITNMDYEHLDYYHTWENIAKAYKDFVLRTKDGGMVIACREDKPLITLIQETGKKFQTYGFSKECDIWAEDITYKQFSTIFRCVYRGKSLGQIELAVPGRHNVSNALAAVLLGLSLSIDFEAIQESLAEFRGVERRFQVIGNVNDILVIDDYAHHPTEITATLKAAHPIRKKRLVVVFQPHRYSRVKFLGDEFAKSLTNCDCLFLTDIYAASEKPIDGITSEKLAAEIRKLTSHPVHYSPKEQLIERLSKEVRPGDMVMMLGAGDITRLGREFVQALESINSTVEG